MIRTTIVVHDLTSRSGLDRCLALKSVGWMPSRNCFCATKYKRIDRRDDPTEGGRKRHQQLDLDPPSPCMNCCKPTASTRMLVSRVTSSGHLKLSQAQMKFSSPP